MQKREINEMLQDLTVADFNIIDKRTYSLRRATTKILDEISDTFKVDKSKVASILLAEAISNKSMQDIEFLLKRRLM